MTQGNPQSAIRNPQFLKSAIRNPQSAILLLGPTGAGKSPLGDLLGREGLNGIRCCHFDFGHNLRAVAGAEHLPQLFSEDELSFVRAMLRAGALLERETFYIAGNILRWFVSEHAVQSGDLVIMNGFPRHVAQAEYVDQVIDVQKVVFLECTPQVVLERIRLNSGGDRANRSDDALVQIEEKLRIYRERTIPLLDHYGQKGVSIAPVQVGADTTAADILKQITREDQEDGYQD